MSQTLDFSWMAGWLHEGPLWINCWWKKITFFNEKGGPLFVEVLYRLAEMIRASWNLTRLNAIKSGPNKKQPEQIPQGGRLALWIALITSLLNSPPLPLSLHFCLQQTWKQGGRCCANARTAFTERSGSSTKGRTPNIRYFVAKLSIVAINAFFKRLA